MKKHLTQLDLIRFIYKETSTLETLTISEALIEDPLLLEEFTTLYDSYLQLPKAQFNPRPAALKNIMRYSEQTALNPMH